MKKRLLIIIWIFAHIIGVSARPTFNIKEFGAKGNGKSLNTEAFNNAIKACSDNGGGVVYVPKGCYLTGTIEMQSNVELSLAKDAQIVATPNLSEYKSYVCNHDGFQHYKMAYSAYWNKALILAINCQNIAITGEGEICMHHIEDPEGEERIRGPHCILFAETSNFTLRGVHISQAGNYNFMGYHLENGVFENLNITEGYDGIHIRGGKRIVIRNCNILTGDDAIAGGWWENFAITHCNLNSTCFAVRVIFPATNFEFGHSVCNGPGKFPQRNLLKQQGLNSVMMSAIILQPGAWLDVSGKLSKIYIHDLEIDNIYNVICADLKRSTWAEDIVIERIKATRIYKSPFQIQSFYGGWYEDVTIRDVDIQYVGRTDDGVRKIKIRPVSTNPQIHPYWGMYLQNIHNLTLDNIKLSYTGEECRSAIGIENVFNVDMNKVWVQDVPGKDKIKSINSELSPTRTSNKYIPYIDPYAKKRQ